MEIKINVSPETAQQILYDVKSEKKEMLPATIELLKDILQKVKIKCDKTEDEILEFRELEKIKN